MTEQEKKYQESHAAARRRYDAKYTRHFGMKVNIRTEADILAQLTAQESLQGYIKRLIREDIERNGPAYTPEDYAAIPFQSIEEE